MDMMNKLKMYSIYTIHFTKLEQDYRVLDWLDPCILEVEFRYELLRYPKLATWRKRAMTYPKGNSV